MARHRGRAYHGRRGQGNRLQRQVLDGNDTYYYYDPNTDELLQETTADANIFYTYNDNGSLIEEANDAAPIRSYTYDYRNRLASVAVGGTTVNYTYNVAGIRVKAQVGGSTTKYLIDPYNHTGYAHVLRADVAGDANTVYVYGHDPIAQAEGTASPQYFLWDGHGAAGRTL